MDRTGNASMGRSCARESPECFTTPGDLSTPNQAYFDRAAQMINLAAAKGMVVLLDPAETGGWLGVLEANGVRKARASRDRACWFWQRFRIQYPSLVS